MPSALATRVSSVSSAAIVPTTAAERLARLGPSVPGYRALAGVRVAAAIVGTLAGVLTLLALVARALGTWIS